LSEWHIDPVYINNNWTDELLEMMILKLSERKQREADAWKSKDTTVSPEHLAARSSGMIEYKKAG